jgi:hypothetical protein
MKRLRQLCAAVLLTCALALPTFAGEISCGITSEPPSTPTSQAMAEGEIPCGLTQAALTILQTVLLLS